MDESGNGPAHFGKNRLPGAQGECQHGIFILYPVGQDVWLGR